MLVSVNLLSPADDYCETCTFACPLYILRALYFMNFVTLAPLHIMGLKYY